jgi:hypothetical protein
VLFRSLPVVTRIAGNGHRPGEAIDVTLTGIDPVRRLIAMEASG